MEEEKQKKNNSYYGKRKSLRKNYEIRGSS